MDSDANPNLELLIGNKNLSSWSMRPWLLLRQAGIAFREQVLLFERSGWREKIVKLSPSRRVPALRDGEIVVWDSLAICEYIAESFPEARLWPKTKDARAVARSVSAEMHAGFASLRKDMSMDLMARVPRRTFSLETQSDVDRVIAIWHECRTRFGEKSGGPFLFGEFSVADAMFAPVVWRFRTHDVPIESSAASLAWYTMMLELPAMKQWEREAEAEVHAANARNATNAANAANAANATNASRSSTTTPDPTSAQHCFAVIFSSQLTAEATTKHGYERMAALMEELAKKQPGFLGIESARNADGFGVTISYWDSLEAITRWKANAEHQKAQRQGREVFYERYEIRVCNVERGYKLQKPQLPQGK